MQTTPINPAAAMGTVTSPVTGQGQAATGDFMATFLQMLGGQQQTTGFGELDQLLGGQSDSEDDPNSMASAMDLMSMLFMQSDADVNFTPSPMGYQGGTQTAAVQQAGTDQLYRQSQQVPATFLTNERLAALAQNATPEQLLQALTGTGNDQSLTDQLLGNTAATTTPTGDNTLPRELVNALRSNGVYYTGQTENSIAPTVDPLQSAYNRLYGNTRTTAATTKDGNGEIDLEALQQAVNNGTYRTAPAVREIVNGTEQIAPRDILQQVQTGITERLAQSQEPGEFTIKLRPEGLGEITVKLVETAGKIALSITTTTQQAQNALTGELGALREALRPYNAEVSQIVQNDPSAAYAQQQNTGEHQHNHGSQQDGRSSGQRYWVPEDDTPPETIRSYAETLGSNLNAYI